MAFSSCMGFLKLYTKNIAAKNDLVVSSTADGDVIIIAPVFTHVASLNEREVHKAEHWLVVAGIMLRATSSFLSYSSKNSA